MDALYPNLHDKFKSEGVCPICLLEMELTPRYSCSNGHTICYRCKPHFYGCPTCQLSLNLEVVPGRNNPPYPPTPSHFFPHPLPPVYSNSTDPSAPPMYDNNDFLDQERKHPWGPPIPPEDSQLLYCTYSYLGCWIKIPEYLKQLHESRCQFRPHMEEEKLPTDLRHDQNDLVECSHSIVGCKVRMPVWRKSIHENICNYKEKFTAMNAVIESIDCVTINDDPEELVECRFRMYGCMVTMPKRKKYTHEQKCNYMSTDCNIINEDPEELVECRFRMYGCMVTMPRRKKYTHEQKCNYMRTDCSIIEENPEELVECRYRDYGCMVTMPRRRRDTHELKCNYRIENHEEQYYPNPELNPEEQVDCKWANYGCRVRPKRHRQSIHEEK
ncbi:hypothetical protein M0802_011413 [Mischocyttarus mexicanus]|nr:hypothetical protein M0802_011413 [Mischocyttarus mexicanus]